MRLGEACGSAVVVRAVEAEGVHVSPGVEEGRGRMTETRGLLSASCPCTLEKIKLIDHVKELQCKAGTLGKSIILVL